MFPEYKLPEVKNKAHAIIMPINGKGSFYWIKVCNLFSDPYRNWRQSIIAKLHSVAYQVFTFEETEIYERFKDIMTFLKIPSIIRKILYAISLYPEVLVDENDIQSIYCYATESELWDKRIIMLRNVCIKR